MSEMNSYNYTPSDLIGLFIDGELGEAERETLFDALSGNAELQAEFERALHIKAVVAEEVLKTVPPVALTNAIFANAGFEVVSSASGVSVGSAGQSGFLKMLLIPVLSAVLASALTGVVLYEHFEKKLEEIAFKNRALKESSVASDSFKNEETSQELHERTNNNSANLPFTQAQRVGNFSSGVGMARPADGNLTRTSNDFRRFRASRNDNMLGNTFKNNSNNVILKPFDYAQDKLREESTPEEPRAIIASIEKTEFLKNSTQFLKSEKSEFQELEIPDFKNEFPEENSTTYSVFIRGISSIRLFPNRTIEAPPIGSFKNTAVGALYNFDENNAFGGEIGREDFPIYIVDNSGALQPTSGIFWAGAMYRYSLDGIDFFGKIQPYAQALAGGSRSGPIGKMAVGIVYRPFKNVSFSGNIEGTGLLYGYGNELYSAGKIGASYGIGIEF